MKHPEMTAEEKDMHEAYAAYIKKTGLEDTDHRMTIFSYGFFAGGIRGIEQAQAVFNPKKATQLPLQ